jgi:TonB family protein
VAASDETTRYLPGRSYEDEGIRWSDRFSRFGPSTRTCHREGIECYFDALVIRNENNRDIRCAIRVVYPQPNEAGISNVEGFEIIRRGEERRVVQRLNVPADLLPESFESRCSLPPALAPLDNPPDCKLQFVKIPDPSLFYPPGSIRRNEQGPVIVEFTLAEARGKPADIVVVRGSDHEDLDDAAKNLTKEIVATTTCPGRRFRTMIPFRLTD